MEEDMIMFEVQNIGQPLQSLLIKICSYGFVLIYSNLISVLDNSLGVQYYICFSYYVFPPKKTL